MSLPGQVKDGLVAAVQRQRLIREGRLRLVVNEERRARGSLPLESLQRGEEGMEVGQESVVRQRSLGEEGGQLRRKLRRRQRLRSTTQRPEVTPQLQVMLL